VNPHDKVTTSDYREINGMFNALQQQWDLHAMLDFLTSPCVKCQADPYFCRAAAVTEECIRPVCKPLLTKPIVLSTQASRFAISDKLRAAL
jgi:hypothetical protein